MITFSLCLFVCLLVCLFVSLSRCLSGRFNYEGLVPHAQYFAGTLLGMSSCASYVLNSILGLSRWNRNCNIRNSYSYIHTVNKIRFHFQFPRSPDGAFGGLIGWLFNRKCKFSCRMISSITNYLKYNYFLDGDGIDNITLRLWKLSDFYTRHTVGVAGDDIMFHILVHTVFETLPVSAKSLPILVIWHPPWAISQDISKIMVAKVFYAPVNCQLVN